MKTLKSICENIESEQVLSLLKKDYPSVKIKSKSEFDSFLKEWAPAIIYAYMLRSRALKVCSNISPAFAIFANSKDFATFIDRIPGHVYNVVLTLDGFFKVDLSAIQFEFCLGDDDDTDDKEMDRLLSKAAKNPLSIIKISKYETSVSGLEIPPKPNKETYFDPVNTIEKAKKLLSLPPEKRYRIAPNDKYLNMMGAQTD